MLTILFKGFISIDKLEHCFKFVDEVRARTHEKAALQNPDFKKNCVKTAVSNHFNIKLSVMVSVKAQFKRHEYYTKGSFL